MARLLTAGGETAAVATEGFTKAGTGTDTFDTGTFRSGARSLKYDSTAGNLGVAHQFTFTGATSRDYFVRAYVRFPATPSTVATIIRLFNATHTCYVVRLSATGTLQLFTAQAGTQVGSDSAALSTDTWYRVELRVKIVAGASDEAELRLDGSSIASTAVGNVGDVAPATLQIGWPIGAPGANAVIFLDDVALNDDQGASQNTWPGDGKVVLLKPISDNARATLWTGGAGGTTSLFDAVDNTPPVGTATETNTTQIEHAGGAAGTTDAYDANMTTPATAGIASGDTINTAHFIEVDGEDVATGSKLLNFEVLSNPVIASPGNVTAGDDVGALGTYPTNWTARRSSPVYGSSLTLGTSPVMRARRPETASRVASVCFMGIYVDYTPAVAVSSPPDRGRRRRSMQRTRV